MAMYANIGGANKLLAQTSAEASAGGGVVSVILSEDSPSHNIQGNTILFSCAGNYAYKDKGYITNSYSYPLAPFMGIYDMATNILEGFGPPYKEEDSNNHVGYVNNDDIYIPYCNDDGNTHIILTLSISNGVVTCSTFAKVHFTYIILA